MKAGIRLSLRDVRRIHFALSDGLAVLRKRMERVPARPDRKADFDHLRAEALEFERLADRFGDLHDELAKRLAVDVTIDELATDKPAQN